MFGLPTYIRVVPDTDNRVGSGQRSVEALLHRFGGANAADVDLDLADRAEIAGDPIGDGCVTPRMTDQKADGGTPRIRLGQR